MDRPVYVKYVLLKTRVRLIAHFSLDPTHPITPSTTRSRIALAAPNVKTLNVSGCFIIFFSTVYYSRVLINLAANAYGTIIYLCYYVIHIIHKNVQR